MNTRLFALFAAVLAIAVAVVAVGCGSSDDSTESTDSTESASIETSDLTKAEFIKEADAICEDGGDAISGEAEAYAEENGMGTDEEPTESEKEELVTEVIVPNIETQADEIEELGAPSGEEETVGEIVDGIRTAAAETGDDPSAVLSGEVGAFDSVNELAVDYGLKVCGEA